MNPTPREVLQAVGPRPRDPRDSLFRKWAVLQAFDDIVKFRHQCAEEYDRVLDALADLAAAAYAADLKREWRES